MTVDKALIERVLRVLGDPSPMAAVAVSIDGMFTDDFRALATFAARILEPGWPMLGEMREAYCAYLAKDKSPLPYEDKCQNALRAALTAAARIAGE